MRTSGVPVRRKLLPLLVAGLLVAGCSSVTAVDPLSATPQAASPVGATVVAQASQTPTADCDKEASLRPGPLPAAGQMPAGSTMAKIVARGRLIVGVDQNTYLFGFRNARTGDLEGFDIGVARQIAKAMLGDESKIEFRVLTSAQRIPALTEGTVDLVVRTFSITCDRLKDISFSSVYYLAQQRVLAPADSGITKTTELAGKTVCATAGSTSLQHLLALPNKPKVLSVADWSDCLVAIQQRQADAVSTDDAILLGIKAQDPYLEFVPGDSLSPEPYGIGVPKGQDDMVRFVNAVLEKMRTDGTWTKLYSTWLSASDVPAPPAAKYRH